MIKDYYKILGVDRQTNEESLKKAYRALVFKYHPDKNKDPNSSEFIKDINEAYSILCDPLKRQNYNYKYDAFLKAKLDITNKTSTLNKQTTNYNQKNNSFQNAKKRKIKFKKFDYVDYAYKGRIVSMFILFNCFLLCLDYFISKSYNHTIVQILNITPHKTKKGVDSFTYEIQSTMINFTVSSTSARLDEEDMLDVEITPIFGIVKSLKNISKNQFLNVITIYVPYFFMIVILLITSSISLIIKNDEKSFTFSLFAGFIFLIVIFFSIL